MVSIAKRGPSGPWRARYRDPDGKQHARHFARKADAQSWLDQVTTAVVTGTYADPKFGRALVREYAKGWEAAQVGREATLSLIDNSLRLHILPALGSCRMASVRPSDIQSLIRNLTEHYSVGHCEEPLRCAEPDVCVSCERPSNCHLAVSEDNAAEDRRRGDNPAGRRTGRKPH